VAVWLVIGPVLCLITLVVVDRRGGASLDRLLVGQRAGSHGRCGQGTEAARLGGHDTDVPRRSGRPPATATATATVTDAVWRIR
jgi:hypothetical protein